MKKSIKFLILFLIFSSCNENVDKSIHKEFYYPNKSAFLESNDYQLVDVKSFNNFEKLIDSIEILKINSKKAYIKIEEDTTEYNIMTSTFFGLGHAHKIKMRNIISISNDSIKKKDTYSIDDLKKILKLDLENFGKNDRYSQSPNRLTISVTTDIYKLENLLLKICKTYNEIEEESSDTLMLNIQLNRFMGLVPKPPPPLPITDE